MIPWLVALALTGVLVGCGSSNHGPNGGGDVQNAGTVTGRIYDAADRPIQNADLTLQPAGTTQVAGTARSNADGDFTFGVVPAGSYVLSASAGGYASSTQAVTVNSGQVTRPIVYLATRGVSQTVDLATGGRVEHNGGSVTLPTGGLVVASRQVESANVALTVLKPGDDNYTRLISGGFTGIPEGSSRQAEPVDLSIYGVIDTVLTDADGQALQLGPGQTATLEWPISPDADPESETIPVWYLDPTTGVWHQEGVATRDAEAGVYRATVSHFSQWGVGLENTGHGTIAVRLLLNGEPLSDVYVRIEAESWAASGRTGLPNQVLQPGDDPGAEAWITVPGGGTGKVWVQNRRNVWKVARERQLMPGAGGVSHIEIDVTNIEGFDVANESEFEVTLTWGEQPRDLDSHLITPVEPGVAESRPFHVYYAQRGNTNRFPWAVLDTDDVTSYGPETISVLRLLPGTYRYLVHNYSGGSTTLPQSAANVTLITKAGQVRTWNSSGAQPASSGINPRWWHVFNVVVTGQGQYTIEPINQLGESTMTGLSNSRALELEPK